MLIAGFVDPIIFEIGPISVRWYGLIFVTGILVAIVLAMRAAKHRGLDPEFVPDIAMVIVPSGILGARLYEVFVLQWAYYSQHPGEILAIWQGGLAIHGGVLGAVLCAAIFMRYRKQPFWIWSDMIAPGLILAQGIGRWGNFFNQEAYGSPAPLGLVAMMPSWLRDGMTIGGSVMHPTFLYESVWNVLGFTVLYAIQRTKPPAGVVFSLYFVVYNIGRFMIEGLREDSSYILGDFRVAQLMAAIQIIAGLLLFVWHLRRTRSSTSGI